MALGENNPVTLVRMTSYLGSLNGRGKREGRKEEEQETISFFFQGGGVKPERQPRECKCAQDLRSEGGGTWII